MSEEKKTNNLFEGITKDELTTEFINYIVDKKVKQKSNEIWGIVQLYLCEKGMPYIDLIDFMRDKSRVQEAIQKYLEIVQGESDDIENINNILNNLDNSEDSRDSEEGGDVED